MKKLLVLGLVMVMASSAFAVVDTDANMMGIYFDTTADTYCTTADLYAPFNAYVILTNPDFDGLYGFEFGYLIEGPYLMTGSTIANPQNVNVGAGNNFIVGLGTPSVTTEATLLVTFNMLTSDPTAPVYFSLSASEPSSNDLGLPTLLAGDVGNEQPCGYSTIDGVHCAIVNGDCDVVATENVSFDSVKSLYR